MSNGYYTFTRITDFGPYVTRILLPLPAPVVASAVDTGCFSVHVRRLDERGDVMLLAKTWFDATNRVASQGYIPVTKAYPANQQGQPLPEGNFLALEMAYGPLFPLSARVSCPQDHNVYVHMQYEITQIKALESKDGTLSGLHYGFPLGDCMPAASGWHNSCSAGEEPLGYGYFIPQTAESSPRPLIVWLHGAGEGGQDPTIAYTANKVVALTAPKVQALFGGAYVLAPQAPTFWMNDGSGEYGHTGKSIYSQALKACIDQFIAQNPHIDRNRVFIGGDSNGGFMTMRMLIDFPDLFAAAFPICEALYDDVITDENIAAIKDKGIWFTHAKNDPVVIPQETVEPTYHRLIKAGAQNVHFTFWDKIEDIHEGFTGENGQPFEYMGHFAWIPMLNDDCRLDYDGSPVTWDGQEVSLLTWLSRQGL
ncbi:prolyl oligopeptidase family serine peptidase [Acutalibacter caecimuris]|uniref:prolyl oligopeptidase family serine peptidase n=1 Tax=Acutalibacter caecimuris TaxID=3093657 RepID=UPI002AC9C5E3|nr:prolyl oligopeptidase family serine peptidase [Acutalibacter sp. M00118]